LLSFRQDLRAQAKDSPGYAQLDPPNPQSKASVTLLKTLDVLGAAHRLIILNFPRLTLLTDITPAPIPYINTERLSKKNFTTNNKHVVETPLPNR